MIDFSGVEKLFKAMMWCCIIFVPLGMWKVIELIGWVWERIANG